MDDTSMMNSDPGAKPVPKRKRVALAPRLKLSFELVKEANGFQEVFQTFPDQFRRNFKGKGHEVKDLETLLLMYYDWSKRVIPGGMTFDTFVNQMEGMGGTASVKAELRELRQGIYSMVEEAVAAAQPTDAHEDATVAAAAAADLPAASPGAISGRGLRNVRDWGDDDMDEEILQEAAQSQPSVAPRRGQPPPAAAVGELDDDELLELMGMDYHHPAGSGPSPSRRAASSAAPAPTATSAAARSAQQPLPPGADDLDDDELLELMGMDSTPPNYYKSASPGRLAGSSAATPHAAAGKESSQPPATVVDGLGDGELRELVGMEPSEPDCAPSPGRPEVPAASAAEAVDGSVGLPDGGTGDGGAGSNRLHGEARAHKVEGPGHLSVHAVLPDKGEQRCSARVSLLPTGTGEIQASREVKQCSAVERVDEDRPEAGREGGSVAAPGAAGSGSAAERASHHHTGNAHASSRDKGSDGSALRTAGCEVASAADTAADGTPEGALGAERPAVLCAWPQGGAQGSATATFASSALGLEASQGTEGAGHDGAGEAQQYVLGLLLGSESLGS